MKLATFIDKAGTRETGDVLIIVSKEEAKILCNMATEYCDRHKREKKAQRLGKEIEEIPCW